VEAGVWGHGIKEDPGRRLLRHRRLLLLHERRRDHVPGGSASGCHHRDDGRLDGAQRRVVGGGLQAAPGVDPPVTVCHREARRTLAVRRVRRPRGRLRGVPEARVQVAGGEAIGGRGDDGIAQGVVVRLEDEGHILVEKIVGPKGTEEEGRHRAPLGRAALLGVAGHEDLDARRAADLLEELAAVAAGHVGDGDGAQRGLPRGGGVGHEELLRVDGVAQRDAAELEVDADVDAAAGAQPHGAHLEVRDRDLRALPRGRDQKRQQVLHGRHSGGSGAALGILRAHDEPRQLQRRGRGLRRLWRRLLLPHCSLRSKTLTRLATSI